MAVSWNNPHSWGSRYRVNPHCVSEGGSLAPMKQVGLRNNELQFMTFGKRLFELKPPEECRSTVCGIRAVLSQKCCFSQSPCRPEAAFLLHVCRENSGESEFLLLKANRQSRRHDFVSRCAEEESHQ